MAMLVETRGYGSKSFLPGLKQIEFLVWCERFQFQVIESSEYFLNNPKILNASSIEYFRPLRQPGSGCWYCPVIR